MSDNYRVGIEIEGKDPAWVIGGLRRLLGESEASDKSEEEAVLEAPDGTKVFVRDGALILEFASTSAARLHGGNMARMQDHCTRYIIAPKGK